MSGTSNITGLESIIYTDNVSFDGTERGGAMTTDGELWIGSTDSRHVRKGSLTSPDGSINIGYSAPNITLQAVGGFPEMISKQSFYQRSDFGSIQSPFDGFIRYSSGGSGGTVGQIGNHYGIINLNTSTSSTGRSILTPGIGIKIGFGELTIEWCINVLTALSTVAEAYQVLVGLYDNNYTTALASVNNVMGFYYTHGTNSGNWTAYTKKSGSVTNTQNLNVAVAADTWYILRMVINADASNCNFYINENLVGTLSSNLPLLTAALDLGCYIEKTNGNTSRTMYADYCETLYNFTNVRYT